MDHLVDPDALTPEEDVKILAKDKAEKGKRLDDILDQLFQQVLFKSISADEGQRFSNRKLKRIQQAAKKLGIDTIEDSAQAAKYLDFIGAEAAYLPEENGQGVLVFRKNPSRSQVVEELLHYGQARKLGFKALSTLDIAKLEVEAQNRLIDIAQRLEWTHDEVDQIKRAKAQWQTDVKRLEKEQNE
jgi:hypothetical protein